MSTVKLWLLCVLLLAAVQARAQDTAPTVLYGTKAGQLVGGPVTQASPSTFARLIGTTPTDFPRLVNRGFAVGDVGIRDPKTVRLGAAGGADVAMVLDRRMPWHAIGKVGASLLKTLPLVATGVAVWELYNDHRVRPNGAGGLVLDAGANSTTVTGWCHPARQFGSFLVVSQCGYVSSGAAGSAFFSKIPQNACMSRSRRTYVNTGQVGNALTWDLFAADFADDLCTQLNTASRKIGTDGATMSSSGTVQSCPASTGLNETIPAGLPPGPDGKCRTGSYTTPISETAAGDRNTTLGDKAKAGAVALGLLGAGVDLTPSLDIPTSGGPATANQPSVTTTTTTGGQTTTTTNSPITTITYQGDSYTWNDSTTTTINAPSGVTTTTTNETPADKAPAACGAPGQPPCKIDETGTPSVIPPFSTSTVDSTKTTDATKQTTEIGRVIDPGFGWFAVPPMATCAPIAWPGGVQINPCNGIEVVRSIMAYLWALYGAVWSFGVFRRSLPGAA